MRILITGGAGFIGSHLAERLLQQGHSIEVWDRDASKEGNIAHLRDRYKGRFWSALYDCRYIYPFGTSGFDFIYHLAATVGVKRVLQDPRECITNNIDALRAVLSLGSPGIFASTSEIYGKSDADLSEESDLTYSSKSRWSYATSKLVGEFLVQQTPGWKTVRFFNVVGPRQNTQYGAVLPQFVSQVLNDEPLTVYGDGTQIRTFLDVRDCAEILDALRTKEFGVVNVGGQNVLSINDLAMEVSHALGRRTRRIHIDYSSVYPSGFEECRTRIPNLTKLNSLLPERSSTAFATTIKDLAEAINPCVNLQMIP